MWRASTLQPYVVRAFGQSKEAHEIYAFLVDQLSHLQVCFPSFPVEPTSLLCDTLIVLRGVFLGICVALSIVLLGVE